MRSELYLDIINDGVTKLSNFQDINKTITEGCFFYPYWRLRKEKYVNSRWQEAVLTLSWYYSKFHSEETWIRILKGVDFWCKLQHKNGSFPEYSRLDRSFSATAFSTLAMINSIIILNYSKEKWIEKINKSCEYLMKNDELFLTNQEMAASLALLKTGTYLNEPRYIDESERKLDIVLKNQSSEGFYKENNGFDLGYSSLTLELLGHYYLATKDKKILDSAVRFINLFLQLDLKKLNNIRKTDWIIVGGFEIFSHIKNGKMALKKVLNRFNVQHLEYAQNLCTDLYRLCYAYDNCKSNLEHDNISREIKLNKTYYQGNRPRKILNLARFFGIHKIRRAKNILT